MGRIEKVNQTIKRVVSEIVLFEVKDPRLEFVTITSVEVSRDLQHARVYYSVLGDAGKVQEAGEALNNAKKFIRRLISQRVEIRCIPEFNFIFDKSTEYSARITQALDDIKNEHKSDSANN